jgi:hypothetical protein
MLAMTEILRNHDGPMLVGLRSKTSLVASELETRWNNALARVRELQVKREKSESITRAAPVVDTEALLALAEDREF